MMIPLRMSTLHAGRRRFIVAKLKAIVTDQPLVVAPRALTPRGADSMAFRRNGPFLTGA